MKKFPCCQGLGLVGAIIGWLPFVLSWRKFVTVVAVLVVAGDDGEMTGGVELDAGDDIVESAGEKTGALDTDDTGGNDDTMESDTRGEDDMMTR